MIQIPVKYGDSEEAKGNLFHDYFIFYNICTCFKFTILYRQAELCHLGEGKLSFAPGGGFGGRLREEQFFFSLLCLPRSLSLLPVFLHLKVQLIFPHSQMHLKHK